MTKFVRFLTTLYCKDFEYRYIYIYVYTLMLRKESLIEYLPVHIYKTRSVHCIYVCLFVCLFRSVSTYSEGQQGCTESNRPGERTEVQ